MAVRKAARGWALVVLVAVAAVGWHGYRSSDFGAAVWSVLTLCSGVAR